MAAGVGVFEPLGAGTGVSAKEAKIQGVGVEERTAIVVDSFEADARVEGAGGSGEERCEV